MALPFKDRCGPSVLHGGLVVSRLLPRSGSSGHPFRRWSQRFRRLSLSKPPERARRWMYSVVVGRDRAECSALALLVARVLADDHDAAVATDHLALVTHRLDARVDLHDARPF